MSHRKCFEHLSIPLEDIKLATHNFNQSNFIGNGGFGNVYEGELGLSGRRVTVAVKHLDRKLGQGGTEFWNEVSILSEYKHENVVSLLGFSDEHGEKILVYEYLPNKSLNKHLHSTNLSWVDRLNICIGVARGLKHLHKPNGTKECVLHRDIKSFNILLDTIWNAKISDFGLSSIISANKNSTLLQFASAAGTRGYCDQVHLDTGLLTKEIDVCSFGILLFEVLCGRNGAFVDEGRPLLSELAQNCYRENKMSTIVLDSLQEQISECSLHMFTAIAYKCLRKDHKKRPSIAKIVHGLKLALLFQGGSYSWEEGRLNYQALSPLVKNTWINNSDVVRVSKKTVHTMESVVHWIHSYRSPHAESAHSKV